MSPDFSTLEKVAQQIVATGKELHQRGWTPATSSNFSARLDDAHCAITVSGKHKGKLQLEDIMVVDLQGIALDDRTPSAETLLHTQLYQWQSSIQAVLHTHSPAVTVFSMQVDAESVTFQGYELQKAFPGGSTHESEVTLPIFENSQDIPALARDVTAWLQQYPDCPAYLIRGHGAYTWGDSISSCERHLEALEFLVSCELQRMAICRR